MVLGSCFGGCCGGVAGGVIGNKMDKQADKLTKYFQECACAWGIKLVLNENAVRFNTNKSLWLLLQKQI
jgi:hypothetical protein